MEKSFFSEKQRWNNESLSAAIYKCCASSELRNLFRLWESFGLLIATLYITIRAKNFYFAYSAKNNSVASLPNHVEYFPFGLKNNIRRNGKLLLEKMG